MSSAEKFAATQMTAMTDLNRLHSAERISAACSKYAAAVELYASSSLSVREIAKTTGLSPKALSSHLSRHHRPLLYSRYGIDPHEDKQTKVKSPRGQSRSTHLKYKDAIEACGDIAYVEFNVSDIARIFGLDPTGLSSQLRVHYPDIIPAREALRERLGIADRIRRGAHAASISAYEEAVKAYADSDLTIQQIAEHFGISASGLSRYMRHYRHDAVEAKARRRSEAKEDVYYRRECGRLSGNGQTYGPRKQSSELYERAVQLYLEGRRTIEEVIAETNVPPAGFRHYLDQWRRKERQSRKEGKYGAAIASLKERPRAVTIVAKEYGLNADVFREYLRNHAPELADDQGMVRLESGRLVKKTAWEKYRPAIEQYRTAGGSIREIALSHGLKYPSLLSFIRRMEDDKS